MTIDCTNIKLQKGSTGDKVKQAQTILKSLGFYGGVIDGDYGEMTVDAVNKFQRSKGLAVDGWIGQVTCKALNNSQTSTSTTITPFKDIAGKKFMKADIIKMAKTFRTHIKNNKNYPNYLTIMDNNGKYYNMGKSAYMGLFEDVSIFFIKNGRMPNYAVFDSTANNPLVIDYQNNGSNCGPSSLSMCMQMLAEWIPEPTLAKEMGTSTSSGTSPSQLKYGAKTHGFELVEIGRDISSVRKALAEGSPVLMHIHTSYSGGRSCLGYYGSYGHYIMCYGTSGDYYKIADPTKGFKTCYCTGIDNARSSTNMKYYRLNPVG